MSDAAGEAKSVDLSDIDPAQRAAILVEALPYIQAFAGRDRGREARRQRDGRRGARRVVRRRHRAAARRRPPAGGRARRRSADRRDAWPASGKEPEFRDGLRVTDAETLDIARMVLGGQVNRDDRRRPSTATTRSPSGCRGEDAGPDRRPPARPEPRLRRRRRRRRPRHPRHACSTDGFIPVISTIGTDGGGQAYNINADSAAIAIAEALEAEKLIYLTDVAGRAHRRRRPVHPDLAAHAPPEPGSSSPTGSSPAG